MKKIRPEVAACVPTSGSFFELMDMFTLPLLNVTAEELDFISEKMTEQEHDDLQNIYSEKPTFTMKRRVLEIRNKYLKLFNQEKGNEMIQKVLGDYDGS